MGLHFPRHSYNSSWTWMVRAGNNLPAGEQSKAPKLSCASSALTVLLPSTPQPLPQAAHRGHAQSRACQQQAQPPSPRAGGSALTITCSGSAAGTAQPMEQGGHQRPPQHSAVMELTPELHSPSARHWPPSSQPRTPAPITPIPSGALCTARTSAAPTTAQRAPPRPPSAHTEVSEATATLRVSAHSGWA